VISLWAWLLGGATGMESTGHFQLTRRTTKSRKHAAKMAFPSVQSVQSPHTYEKHTHTRLLLQRMLDAELIFSFIFGDGIKWFFVDLYDFLYFLVLTCIWIFASENFNFDTPLDAENHLT
jgi:hypothetical protein